MNTQSTPYSYRFTRTVNKVHWTIEISSADGRKVDIEIMRGPVPFWHTLDARGTCLIDNGFGSRCVGFECTRLQALRYAACAIANLHGGGIGSGGNRPGSHRRIWSPKALKQLIRDTPLTGPWVEFDCVNFDYRDAQRTAA